MSYVNFLSCWRNHGADTVLNTKRIIFSPFAKDYRVLRTPTDIPFLFESPLHEANPHQSNTMRKKELKSFSHCGSFDQSAMYLRNDYRFVYSLGLSTEISRIRGLVTYHWKGLAIFFPLVYYKLPTLLNGMCKMNKENV